MKLLRFALPLLCAVALAVSLSACHKNTPPVPGPADPEAEEYSVANKIAQDLKTAVAEIGDLQTQEETGVLVRVTNENGLSKVLEEKSDRTIRLEGKEADGEVTIPAGDYSARSVILDAPNASLVSDADLGAVTVKSLGEAGCTFNGHVGTLFVAGGDLNVTLAGGADKVYVTGARANVTLAGGEFPVVYCDNLFAVIANKTEAAVNLILPNGVAKEIPAGKAYSMETGKLTRAK